MIILMDIINIYMEKTTKKQKTYEWEFNFNLGDAAVIEKKTQLTKWGQRYHQNM